MSVVSKYVTKVTALTTPSNPYAKKNKAVLKALAEAGYSRAIFKAAATYFDEYADYTVYNYSLAIGYHVALKDITAADRRAMSELVTKKAIKLGFAVTDSTGVIFIPRGMDFLKAIGEDRTPREHGYHVPQAVPQVLRAQPQDQQRPRKPHCARTLRAR